jgi:hypothetical protein
MARIKKGPEGIAANRPQQTTPENLEVNGGLRSGVHNNPSGLSSQFVTKGGEAVGLDLGNGLVEHNKGTDVARNLSNDVGHVAPAKCEESIIVAQNGEIVNALHSQVRKYLEAGIAICLGPKLLTLETVDSVFAEVSDVRDRIEAAQQAIATAEATKAKAEADEERYREVVKKEREAAANARGWARIAADLRTNPDKIPEAMERCNHMPPAVFHQYIERPAAEYELQAGFCDRRAAETEKKVVEAQQQRKEAEAYLRPTRLRPPRRAAVRLLAGRPAGLPWNTPALR